MIAVGKRVFIAGKEVFFVGVGVEVINKCVILLIYINTR
jgi:hypothetical protein